MGQKDAAVFNWLFTSNILYCFSSQNDQQIAPPPGVPQEKVEESVWVEAEDESDILVMSYLTMMLFKGVGSPTLKSNPVTAIP